MNIRRYVKNFFIILFNPKFWTFAFKVDKIRDKEINDLLDKYKPVGIYLSTLQFDSFEIWVGDYPYSYGQIYSMNRKLYLIKYRPCIDTIIRIKKIEENFKKELDRKEHQILSKEVSNLLSSR